MKETPFVPLYLKPSQGDIEMECQRGHHPAFTIAVCAEETEKHPEWERICAKCVKSAVQLGDEVFLPFGMKIEETPESYRKAIATARENKTSHKPHMVCRRLSTFPDSEPPPGGAVTVCSTCSESVIIMPSNYLKAIEEDLTIICWNCRPIYNEKTDAYILLDRGRMEVLGKDAIDVIRKFNNEE